jgi:hypothetical protein
MAGAVDVDAVVLSEDSMHVNAWLICGDMAACCCHLGGQLSYCACFVTEVAHAVHMDSFC